MKVLVMCPMKLEKSLIKEAFSTLSKKVPLNADFKVVECGIGKVSAATETFNQLISATYTAVFLIGYAGATPNYQIGDLVIPEFAQYSDVKLPPGLIVTPLQQKYPLQGSEGVILTSDSFIDEYIYSTLSLPSESCLFDMEATAVAQTCVEFNIVPCVVKMVSDIPTIPSPEPFEQAITKAPLNDFMPIANYINMVVKTL